MTLYKNNKLKIVNIASSETPITLDKDGVVLYDAPESIEEGKKEPKEQCQQSEKSPD